MADGRVKGESHPRPANRLGTPGEYASGDIVNVNGGAHI
jgi:hypothetical protein